MKSNNEVQNRVEKAMEWMHKHNIKVSDKTLQDYINYTNKNLNKIQSFINKINKNGVWASDLPMLFVSTLNQLEINNISLCKRVVYKQKVVCFYKYTHVANDPYEVISDRYEIIYKNETKDISEEINSSDIIELIEKGVLMTEQGVIGLSKQKVQSYIENI